MENIYDEVFGLIERIFGKATEQKLIEKFNDELVKKGKLPEKTLGILKAVARARKQKKISKHEAEALRKDAFTVASLLMEYAQRRDLLALNKIRVKYKKQGKEAEAEAFMADSQMFVIMPDAIKKISNEGVFESNKKELEEALAKNKKPCMNTALLQQLHKLFPEFEIHRDR